MDVGRCLWLPLLWMCCISGGRGIRARRELRKRFLIRVFDTGAGSGVEYAWTDNGDLLGWGVELHAFLVTFYERHAICTSQIRRWVYPVTIVYHYITILKCRFVGKDLPMVPFPVQCPLIHTILFSIRENRESLRRVIQLPSKTTRQCPDTETSATSPLNTKVLTENLSSVLRVGVARERHGSSEVKMNQGDGLSKLCWLFTYSRGGRLCV